MEEKRFTLRMDGELFEEISQFAKRNRRSVAKEVEYAIAQYILQEKERDLLTSVDLKKLTESESLTLQNQLIDLHKRYNR